MSHVDSDAITHVSLCTGYGGIDLGLKRVLGKRLVTVAACEIEAFAAANLVSKAEAGLLDNAPIWSDLKRFPWGKFHGLVDILSGGYPCQPFSAAGKRLGKEDPRHLWPHIADGIAAMRPSLCFFENVEGHISLGLPDVIEDLAGMGYRTTWGIFSASEVGAPHQRKRVFIMSHRSGHGHNWRPIQDGVCGRNIPQLPQPFKGGCSEVRSEVEGCGNDSCELAVSSCFGGEAGIPRPQQGNEGITGIADNGGGKVWPSRPGQPQFSWEPPRVVGNAGCQRQEGAELQPAGVKQYGEGAMVNSEGGSNGQLPSEQQGGNTFGGSGEEGDPNQRQTQPSMGGNPDGTARGVDYAVLQEPDHSDCRAGAEHGGGQLDDTGSTQLNGLPDQQWSENPSSWESGHPALYTSCDNRTDELRLLGNGVVPATAELAFRTLWEELTSE